jgi:hypothetical protein
VTPYAGLDRERNHRAVARLEAVLVKIAEGCGRRDPRLQAQIAINKLLRRIDNCRSSRVRFWRYDHFVGSRWTKRERRERWLCYLIRLTHNKRTIGRRYGLVAGTKPSAIADATTIERLDQLTPVEQRAYKILRGDRRPKEGTTHPIEKRAIKLAEAVEAEWFTTPPRKQRKDQSFETKDQSFEMLKPLLTISEVVSITAPVIEEFAQEKISAKNLGFEALDRTISLCSDVMTRKASASRGKAVSKKSLLVALSRMRSAGRHKLMLKITDNSRPGAKLLT